MSKVIFQRALATPVGWVLVETDERAVKSVSFLERLPPGMAAASGADPAVLELAATELEAYFRRGLRTFSVPIAPAGSPFQRTVWDALLEIPYGEIRSYGDIARRIGKSAAASRAVGLANGRNPIAIIIPCHRVIGADGSLTGYAGGLSLKRWLLGHESGQRPLSDPGDLGALSTEPSPLRQPALGLRPRDSADR